MQPTANRHSLAWLKQLLSGDSKQDFAVAGQHYIVSVYSLLAIMSVATFGVLHIVIENRPFVGYLELAGGCAIAFNLLMLQVTRNVGLARTFLLLSMLALLIVMLFTGGTAGTGIFWYFLFPVSAFFLAGRQQGIGWMSVLFVVIGAIAWLSWQNVVHIPYDLVTLRQLAVSLLVVTVGIYVYQQSRENLTQATKQSLAVTREEKIKAEIIVQNIDEGIIAADTSGRALLVNAAVEEMLQYKASELIGKKIADAVTMADQAGNVIVIDQSAKAWPATMMGITCKRKSGSTFPVALTTRPIVIDGDRRGTILTLRDITAEQAVDRAKSEFVTLASHQLRTPISAIGWVSELLMHGDAGSLTPEQLKYLQQIYKSNERMAALVDAMLTTSTLELGSLPVHPEPLDLRAASQQALATQLKELTGGKQLHINEDYDPALQPAPYDPHIIKTILHNLIANAFKYTPPGGTITVRIQYSNDSLPTSPHGNILMQVIDTGFGIPHSAQNKIFSKLYRADNIKSKDTDGTGLGLYIVKTIVEYIGGRVWLKSTENKGTTFSVLLPPAMKSRSAKRSVQPKVEGTQHE